MKNLIIFFLAIPLTLFANERKVPSKIKEVTVYLSGAQITRKAQFQLHEGTNEVIFTGLSHKIDESSIQVSGLSAVSILSIAYDINYLDQKESNPEVKSWEAEILNLEYESTLLKNIILGLQEEEKVINTNRLVSTDNQALSLEKIKQISQYYRERITNIKNEIFKTQLKINEMDLKKNTLRKQIAEANQAPSKEQGEITITFDAPVTTDLNITLTYLVKDAGWVPNYDIKSDSLNAPLNLVYKANVYQITGQNWEDVKVFLSTGNPDYNIAKPNLETQYLNFVSSYQKRYSPSAKKKGYAFNPNVKKVVGTVTDATGLPLPGANIVIKGTTTGTQTDFDGNYTLEIPYGQELVYSYIGQVTQELPLYSSIMNVRMKEDTSALEEVVVTGYGNYNDQSKAVSAVSAEELIQGKVAGTNLRIRGTNSIKPHEMPLFVVDGVPVDQAYMSEINPQKIQNIEVLKNFETSIYGSRAANGVVLVTTKLNGFKDEVESINEENNTIEKASKTEFIIKKPYSVVSDGDITAIEVNTFKLPANYEYFAAPLINENVFLTASFKDWEKHQLLPGEANIYFEGTYAGKTVLDPYTTKKEMVLSLGIDPNITVAREQDRNFKRKSFTGTNRILNRTYILEVKNNKNVAVDLKLMDRIPKSQNKEIKVEDIVTNSADYDAKKGLLTWKMRLDPKQTQKETFSFKVKYPRGKYISL